MAGSKRMSAEEKRQAILGIYHTEKSVFVEKEIIQKAAEAGVNANTIVDVNTSLVDDGLVEKEKISGSNYYWSFPAKKQRMMQIKYEKTLQTIEDMKVKVEEASARLADAKRGREDDDGERSMKLARLTALGKEKTALASELESLKENDPQALADLEKELKLTTEAAHRWTDNIFNCKDYLVKKKGLDKKEVYRMLQITSNFDYPEDKTPK